MGSMFYMFLLNNFDFYFFFLDFLSIMVHNWKMKKLIRFILNLISRVIYSLIPKEFKKKENEYDIYSKIIEYSKNETFEHFKND